MAALFNKENKPMIENNQSGNNNNNNNFPNRESVRDTALRSAEITIEHLKVQLNSLLGKKLYIYYYMLSFTIIKMNIN